VVGAGPVGLRARAIDTTKRREFAASHLQILGLNDFMKALIVILANLMTAITGMLMSMTPGERGTVAGLRKPPSHSAAQSNRCSAAGPALPLLFRHRQKIHCSSWRACPGLSRPSTNCAAGRAVAVDTRHKACSLPISPHWTIRAQQPIAPHCAERGDEMLHPCRACFETRSQSAPQHEVGS
jgi:hypothetical protein